MNYNKSQKVSIYIYLFDFSVVMKFFCCTGLYYIHMTLQGLHKQFPNLKLLVHFCYILSDTMDASIYIFLQRSIRRFVQLQESFSFTPIFNFFKFLPFSFWFNPFALSKIKGKISRNISGQKGFPIHLFLENESPPFSILKKSPCPPSQCHCSFFLDFTRFPTNKENLPFRLLMQKLFCFRGSAVKKDSFFSRDRNLTVSTSTRSGETAEMLKC